MPNLSRCSSPIAKLVVAWGLLSGLAGTLQAQQPVPQSGWPLPRLNTVFPCGGKAGTTLEVTFTGTDVEDPQSLLFSHPGIHAEAVPPPPPDPKKPGPPPQVTRFKVVIAPETPLGYHDVRLVNRWGVSNARAFVVGDLVEIPEREPNNDVPQAQRVEMNSTITGTIAAANDVDYFTFLGHQGQRVLGICLTRSIDSRMTAGLELYDRAGRLLASNHHSRQGDALIDYTLPADGDYFVRLFEYGHTQGSPEHFYRLSLTTAPWIDAVLPAAVEPGQNRSVTVLGRNLPTRQLDPLLTSNGNPLERAQVTISTPDDPLALNRLTFLGLTPPEVAGQNGMALRLRNASGSSNAYLVSYAQAPLIMEKEPNDQVEKAQVVSVPCEISGQIDHRGDRDWYQFTAKKGAVYRIELVSQRLGAPTDLQLVIHRGDNKQEMAELDDAPDALHPVRFNNRSSDPPAYRFVAPVDGTYQLLVTSNATTPWIGPESFYLLRIVPEKPDFDLFVMPADGFRQDSACLRQGGHDYYTILVTKRDGFDGTIHLSVDGLPEGVAALPQSVGPGLKQASLVLSTTLDAPNWTGPIHVRGTATIGGKSVTHEARPAGITWPVPQGQNFPTVSRLDRQLVLAVRDVAPFSVVITPEKRSIPQGGKISLNVVTHRLMASCKGPIQLTPIEPQLTQHAGIRFNKGQPMTLAPDKPEIATELDVAANVPPGTYTIILAASTPIPFNKDPKAAQKPNVVAVHPTSPLQIEVLPKGK